MTFNVHTEQTAVALKQLCAYLFEFYFNVVLFEGDLVLFGLFLGRLERVRGRIANAWWGGEPVRAIASQCEPVR